MLYSLQKIACYKTEHLQLIFDLEILHLEMISNGISYLVGMNEMLKRGLLFIIVDSDWYWNGCVSTTLHKHVEQVMP